MKNFRVVSVSAMMAAFAATSAWAAAASACPTDEAGWSLDEKTGECYYDITASDATTLEIPIDLKTFYLRYQGTETLNRTINVHCKPQPLATTVSVTEVGMQLKAGSVAIRNRINVKAFGADDEAAEFLESYQSPDDLFSCTLKDCSFTDKVTGFNALSVVFNPESDGTISNSFVFKVNQEPYDFGPMQVYNVKGLNADKINELSNLVSMALSPFGAAVLAQSVSNPAAMTSVLTQVQPLLSDISAILARGFSKVALIEGASDNGLVGLTQDIVVDSVYLNRTFTTNHNNDDGSSNARSTIAFPFDIATDNIQGASEILQFTRIGKDGNNNDAVFMKKVYCADPTGEKCPATNGTLEAYKPYVIQLQEGVTSLEFVNSKEKKAASVTLKATPNSTDFDFTCKENSGWVFRSAFGFHKWTEKTDAAELTACNGMSCIYGYAAGEEESKKGKFVRAGDGAYIYPFRGFLINAAKVETAKMLVKKIAPANSSYALRPNVLPDEMNIVVEGDNNETTVIGSFNTRTGEMKFINNLKHTYDLKGRRVNGVNNARGAYYGKKVMR